VVKSINSMVGQLVSLRLSNRMSHHGDPLFLQVEKAAGSRLIKKILQIAFPVMGPVGTRIE
jgi:hypothetical protein